MTCNEHSRPAGWDNEKKISILYENLNTMKPDDCYEDVIVKPITRKVRVYALLYHLLLESLVGINLSVQGFFKAVLGAEFRPHSQ